MRSTRQSVLRAGAAVLLPLALVGACGGSTPTASRSAAGASTSDSAAVSTTTTTAPAGGAGSATTTTAAPTATPTATATATATPGWPKALGEPQQGDPVWGVYLTVGHSATDPEIDQAVHDAAGVGYQAVVGDIACDGGAMEALQLDQYDYWSGATLYFATQADAQSFAAAFTAKVHAPRGIAKVNVGCLD